MEERALKLMMKDYFGKELAWRLFLGPANEPMILKEKNEERYDKYLKYKTLKRKYTKSNKSIKVQLASGNDKTINKYFNTWKEFNFLDVIITPQQRGNQRHPLKIYQLNLNPFFTYFKEINFSEKEKRILDFLFYPKWVRNSLIKEYGEYNIIHSISKFYFYKYYLNLLENKSKITKINFDKNFLNHFINDLPYKEKVFVKRKGKIKFEIVEKSSRLQKIMEKNTDSYNEYLNSPMNYEVDLSFYLTIYYSLYERYKKEIDTLNIKMLKTLKLS